MTAVCRSVATCIAIVLLGPPLLAQEPGRAVLQISVEDELGGSLAGARITLVQAAASGESREQTSDSKGNVAFEQLTPGEYVLTAASPGFRTLERRIAIGTDKPHPIKLQLKIEVSEMVDVSERKHPLPQRETIEENADAIPVDDDLLAGVPLAFGRDRVAEFAKHFLSPTVGKMSIVMDGQEVNSLNLPSAAIDELVVNKNPYSAEYRRPGKARIEVVSQNGSKSHYHLDSSLIYGDSAVNARGAFMPEKPPLQQWLGESTFGGPLRFYRGSYLVSGSVTEDHSTGIVSALTLGGPLRALQPERQQERFWRGRLDLQPRDTLRFTVKYDFERTHEFNGGVGGLVLPELAYESDDIAHTLRFNARTIPSTAFVNEARVSMDRPTTAIGHLANGAMIVVEGAFSGGIDQHFRRSRAVNFEIQDIATNFRGAHTLRFGGRLRPQFVTTTDASNFGGTFQFSNLEAFAAGRPFTFRVNQGTPQVDYGHHLVEGFAQDEIKLRPDFSLMLGARYDYESNVNDYNNIAPRAAFAFAPGQQKTNIRGGSGVFYERLGETGIEQALLFDGSRTRTLIFANPSYPNPFASGAGDVAIPSRYLLAPDLSSGYLVQSTISVERQVWPRTMLTIEYANVRGFDLARVRDSNAPLPRTGIRPDAAFKEITRIESAGSMHSNSLNVTFHGKLHGLDASAIYTYAHTRNDTPGATVSGALAFALPADNYNPRGEWGRADFDVHHRFNLAGVLKLPAGFQLGSILELTSGKPYDITTGFDDNGDSRATDRPAGLARNAGEAPGFAQLDMRLTKLFRTPRPLKYPASKPGKLSFHIDVFNALNRTNYRQTVGVLSSPLFGHQVSAEKARKINFATSYSF